MIRNSITGGMRPSTLLFVMEASQNIESLRVSEEESFVSLKPECQSGVRTRDLRLSRQAALITALGRADQSRTNIALLTSVQC